MQRDANDRQRDLEFRQKLLREDRSDIHHEGETTTSRALIPDIALLILQFGNFDTTETNGATVVKVIHLLLGPLNTQLSDIAYQIDRIMEEIESLQMIKLDLQLTSYSVSNVTN